MLLASVNFVSEILTLTPFAVKVVGKPLCLPTDDSCVGVIVHTGREMIKSKLARTFHPPLGEGIIVIGFVLIPADPIQSCAWLKTGMTLNKANKKNLRQILYIIIKTLLLLTFHSFLSHPRHLTPQF